MKKRVLGASEFKAKCLAYLSEVEQSGESITITKRGRPVAVLSPVKRSKYKPLAGSWAKRMKILGDIVNKPILWECAESE